MELLGVDISVHNGEVNFDTLKSNGVKFVIIRCGYGSDYDYQDDSMFYENVRKADAAKIPWGVYLYSYAKTPVMAKSEAQHTLRLLNGRKPAYGVWYDVEDPSQTGYDLVRICETYCSLIESAGLYVGIYSMLSWLNGALNNSRLDRYDKWVAQWNNVCTYKKGYGLWQYTDKLVIGGKSFDGNYAYKDYPALTGQKEEEMSEEQIIKLIDQRIEKYMLNLEKLSPHEYSSDAISFVNEKEIMVGDPNGSFRPRSFVTREELAQAIYNAYKSEKI